MRQTLFETIHGSHLYGLAHEDSDKDFYTVVTKAPVDNRWGRQTKARYSKQAIHGDEDSLVIDFGTWLEQCRSGVPQALEAMFSIMRTDVDHISSLRASWRSTSDVYDRYLRTIKSFSYSETDSFKRKRHALRLALNLKSIRDHGRFNPTLGGWQARAITIGARRWDADETYQMAMRLAWS